MCLFSVTETLEVVVGIKQFLMKYEDLFIIAADALATQGVRASSAVILT